MIRISAKHDGFRRCGVAFSREGADFPVDRFSKEELKILQNEPMLSVAISEAPPRPATAAEVIAKINACQTPEEVSALVNGDDRKTVQQAASDKLAALAG